MNHSMNIDPVIGLERLLAPRSIAVVGASNTLSSIGGLVFANLKRSFGGTLYPLHPKDVEVQGIKAYSTLAAIQNKVDMAVIVLAAHLVETVVEQALQQGVGSLLLLSSGFAETNAEGAALQARIAEKARAGNIRVLGPNCIGYVNIADGVMANFALSPQEPLPPGGSVALVSQSGGFGSYLMTKGLLTGLKLGWFVSTGNELDVNLAIVLSWLVERPEVKVLLVFSETLRDPQVFIETARRAHALDKPIIVLKAGRTEAAAKAALSHTASVVGAVDVFDAVCRQYGVLIASSMEDMLDLGMIFQDGRRVRDNRLAILTPSGGAGVLLADEAVQSGLSVPTLPDQEQDELRNNMRTPFFGSVSNPVDTTAAIDIETIIKLLALLGESPATDMLTAVTWARAKPMTDALIELYRRIDKPLAVLSTDLVDAFKQAGVPTYTDPCRVARALAALYHHSTRPPLDESPAATTDFQRIQRALAHLQLPAGERTLMEAQGKRLLAEYAIPITREHWLHSVDDAIAAAANLGTKVALKVMSHDLPHKSDVGALRLNLQGETNIREAWHSMLEHVTANAPDARLDGVLVQEMVPARMELTCGLQRDPVFGPMVAVGLGGVLIEQLAQTVLLRPPFTLNTARNALAGLLGGRLITGRRGLCADEQTALANIMLGVGQMGLELAQVEEIDINPIRVADGRAVAADALVVLRDHADIHP